MSFRSGKNSDAKKLLIRLPEERGDDELYLLDRAQIKALLSLSASIGWRTRHLSFPDYVNTSDKLEQFADETALDLMTPVDFCSQLASCEDELAAIMANLISTNTSVQDAIRDFLSNDETFITNIFQERPLPTGPINPNTEDLGILFAQCVGIVMYTHNAINDLFEVLEVQSNNVELMSNLRLVPALATLMDAAGVGQAIQLVDYMLSIMNEQYDAQWEETPPNGTKWVIACKLFCACKGDMIITVDRIFQTYINLMSQYTAITWDNIQEMVESIVGVNDNSEVMVYSMHAFMWTTAKLASSFGLQTLTSKVLEFILALENTPNDDWEVLCEDCPPEQEEGCFNFVGSKMAWSEYINAFNVHYAQHDSLGWKPDYNPGSIDILKEITGTITKVTVKLADPLVDTLGGATAVYLLNYAGSLITTHTTSGLDEYVFSGLSEPAGIRVAVQTTNAMPTTQRIVEICLEFEP